MSIKNSFYQITKHGGIDSLELKEAVVEVLHDNEVRLQIQSIGVNFIDIYQRKGLYPMNLPAILGQEAIGEVIEVGKNVKDYKIGSIVGFASVGVGSYAKYVNINEQLIFPVPKHLVAPLSGFLLRGLTAEYLINRIGANLTKNDWVLLYAAAGGVGILALQWLKHLGVKVIATVGSEDKALIARKYGADAVIFHNDFTELAKQVKGITGGVGVRIVYDSLGKDSFMASLDSIAPLGTMVSFGNATGAVEPISPLTLMQKGGLFLTRPNLALYYPSQQERLQYSQEFIKLVDEGFIDTSLSKSFAFTDLPQAHSLLENRESIGATWVQV